VSVFWGEQHGWVFCCLGLVVFKYIYIYILIEDLSEGQVF
jgi:hypothetical protein